MEKFKIKSKRDGSFNGTDGRVSYTWYKALRLKDGVTLEFGSKNAGYNAGEELDLELEKSERSGGRFGYKDVTSVSEDGE